MAMRIALFGQAAFAKHCLDRLQDEGHRVVGVFAPPDGGRPDPLAARAEELGIPTVKRRYYRKRTGEAIAAAVEASRQALAGKTLEWLEVIEFRGGFDDGRLQYQTAVRIGYA